MTNRSNEGIAEPPEENWASGGGLASVLRVFGVIWGILGVIAVLICAVVLSDLGLGLLAFFACSTQTVVTIALAEVLKRLRRN